jgi:DNA recombination protein RmuC
MEISLVLIVGLAASIGAGIGAWLVGKLTPAATDTADSIRQDLERVAGRLQQGQGDVAASLRQELAAGLRDARQEIRSELATNRTESAAALEGFARRTQESSAETTTKVERALEAIRSDNERRLGEMRAVVEEKLQKTLEARLGESFRQVSERLDAVSKGLAEVQQITTNINDLKRVMGNVKTRGVWGETFLESLLSESLVPEKQFVKNFKPRERGGDVVEFAIVLPGDQDGPVYLPVDAKFPKEDYERIVAAAEVGDAAGLLQAQRALATTVSGFASDITKYINPPRTTDFAILFLPTEGLYAEVIRHPGMEEALKAKRVLVAGPSTMMGLVHSLRVGFQTLVVQKKSAEIAKLLGAVKKDFGTFGELLDKVNKKLEEASKVVSDATDRHRKISGKMAKVAELPDPEARRLLSLDGDEETGDDRGSGQVDS